MTNKAKEIIVPDRKNVFRIVFLYVGQGDATLLVVPNGSGYKYVLIDSNQDESAGGVHLVKLLKDLFKDEKKGLDVYINTHPHKDHLAQVKAIYEAIGINQVWHSGHKPGKDYKDSYEELEYVINTIGKDNVYVLKGSKEENKLDDKEVKLGKIKYNVLAPAEYVADDIKDEKSETRYQRIHEQCGVIRFKYGTKEKAILITGDADYDAWVNHITDYHKERLPSIVLSAAHHGSNSFFWKDSKTEEKPYKKHLDTIDPLYIIVSAPKKSESKHGHPDKEAMDLYQKHIDKKSGEAFHLGKNRECVIVDIDEDGDINVYRDTDLIKTYGNNKDDKSDGGKGSLFSSTALTKIDKKPMGSL